MFDIEHRNRPDSATLEFEHQRRYALDTPEKKPIPKPPVDVDAGGFANDDDEIRSGQERDVAEEREREATPPDPTDNPDEAE